MIPANLTVIVLSLIAGLTAPVTGHATRTVPEAWPDQAYRVEWQEPHIPDEVVAQRKIAVAVTVRNAGNRVWPASQVVVSYHWLRDAQLVVWDGERTGFPRDLRAGSSAPLSVQVATPTEPGSYVLTLTLVHENVTWFEHRGATMLVRPIVVRPATASLDVGSSGVSTWQTKP
jgi:hypothetical protein